MAQTKTKRPVPAEVRKFLSDNGKKGAHQGGQITKRLIELGKEKAMEEGEDVSAEFRRKKAA
jgi:hypothetical protein